MNARIGGIATQRPRTPRKRVKLVRYFTGKHQRDAQQQSVITLVRGAWVKTAGQDDKRWDATARLVRNVGDALIVMWGRWDEVAYAVVTSVHVDGWREWWTVEVKLGGPIPNGGVTVMAGRRAV